MFSREKTRPDLVVYSEGTIVVQDRHAHRGEVTRKRGTPYFRRRIDN
jgi:hypothetical protein